MLARSSRRSSAQHGSSASSRRSSSASAVPYQQQYTRRTMGSTSPAAARERGHTQSPARRGRSPSVDPAESRGRPSQKDASTNGPARRVKCFVRVRPFTPGDLVGADGYRTEFHQTALSQGLDGRSLRITGEPAMAFDGVFDPNAEIEALLGAVVAPAVSDSLRGLHTAVLLYGQTGSGKTFTTNQLLPAYMEMLLQFAAEDAERYDTRVSLECCQLYLESVYDLLDPAKGELQLREFPDTGVFVRGISEVEVRSMREFDAVLETVGDNRAIAATRLNQSSSRSHCIFTVNVARRRRVNRHDFSLNDVSRASHNVSDAASMMAPGDDEVQPAVLMRGRAMFVDLAGSERLKKSGSEGLRQVEAQYINQSLATLGNVMHALTDPRATHVPYRDSKLTRLLQDALGGRGVASVVVTVSPSTNHVSETRQALTFGMRAMEVTTTATAWKMVDGQTRLVEAQEFLENRAHWLEVRVKQLEAELEAARRSPPQESGATDGHDGVDARSAGCSVQHSLEGGTPSRTAACANCGQLQLELDETRATSAAATRQLQTELHAASQEIRRLVGQVESLQNDVEYYRASAASATADASVIGSSATTVPMSEAAAEAAFAQQQAQREYVQGLIDAERAATEQAIAERDDACAELHRVAQQLTQLQQCVPKDVASSPPRSPRAESVQDCAVQVASSSRTNGCQTDEAAHPVTCAGFSQTDPPPTETPILTSAASTSTVVPDLRESAVSATAATRTVAAQEVVVQRAVGVSTALTAPRDHSGVERQFAEHSFASWETCVLAVEQHSLEAKTSTFTAAAIEVLRGLAASSTQRQRLDGVLIDTTMAWQSEAASAFCAACNERASTFVDGATVASSEQARAYDEALWAARDETAVVTILTARFAKLNSARVSLFSKLLRDHAEEFNSRLSAQWRASSQRLELVYAEREARTCIAADAQTSLAAIVGRAARVSRTHATSLSLELSSVSSMLACNSRHSGLERLLSYETESRLSALWLEAASRGHLLSVFASRSASLAASAVINARTAEETARHSAQGSIGLLTHSAQLYEAESAERAANTSTEASERGVLLAAYAEGVSLLHAREAQYRVVSGFTSGAMHSLASSEARYRARMEAEEGDARRLHAHTAAGLRRAQISADVASHDAMLRACESEQRRALVLEAFSEAAQVGEAARRNLRDLAAALQLQEAHERRAIADYAFGGLCTVMGDFVAHVGSTTVSQLGTTSSTAALTYMMAHVQLVEELQQSKAEVSADATASVAHAQSLLTSEAAARLELQLDWASGLQSLSHDLLACHAAERRREWFESLIRSEQDSVASSQVSRLMAVEQTARGDLERAAHGALAAAMSSCLRGMAELATDASDGARILTQQLDRSRRRAVAATRLADLARESGALELQEAACRAEIAEGEARERRAALARLSTAAAEHSSAEAGSTTLLVLQSHLISHEQQSRSAHHVAEAEQRQQLLASFYRGLMQPMMLAKETLAAQAREQRHRAEAWCLVLDESESRRDLEYLSSTALAEMAAGWVHAAQEHVAKSSRIPRQACGVQVAPVLRAASSQSGVVSRDATSLAVPLTANRAEGTSERPLSTRNSATQSSEADSLPSTSTAAVSCDEPQLAHGDSAAVAVMLRHAEVTLAMVNSHHDRVAADVAQLARGANSVVNTIVSQFTATRASQTRSRDASTSVEPTRTRDASVLAAARLRHQDAQAVCHMRDAITATPASVARSVSVCTVPDQTHVSCSTDVPKLTTSWTQSGAPAVPHPVESDMADAAVDRAATPHDEVPAGVQCSSSPPLADHSTTPMRATVAEDSRTAIRSGLTAEEKLAQMQQSLYGMPPVDTDAQRSPKSPNPILTSSMHHRAPLISGAHRLSPPVDAVATAPSDVVVAFHSAADHLDDADAWSSVAPDEVSLDLPHHGGDDVALDEPTPAVVPMASDSRLPSSRVVVDLSIIDDIVGDDDLAADEVVQHLQLADASTQAEHSAETHPDDAMDHQPPAVAEVPTQTSTPVAPPSTSPCESDHGHQTPIASESGDDSGFDANAAAETPRPVLTALDGLRPLPTLNSSQVTSEAVVSQLATPRELGLLDDLLVRIEEHAAAATEGMPETSHDAPLVTPQPALRSPARLPTTSVARGRARSVTRSPVGTQPAVRPKAQPYGDVAAARALSLTPDEKRRWRTPTKPGGMGTMCPACEHSQPESLTSSESRRIPAKAHRARGALAAFARMQRASVKRLSSSTKSGMHH